MSYESSGERGLCSISDARRVSRLGALTKPQRYGPSAAWTALPPRRSGMTECTLSFAICMILFLPSGALAEQWEQFRGPTGLGFTQSSNLPIRWGGEDNQENVLWRSPLFGEGHASPIVSGGRVVVCTVRWPDSVQERAKVIPEHHVLCYSAANGKRLWDTVVTPGPWLRTDFRSGAGGGYAAPTPTSDGKLIYAMFGSSVIAALDFDGRVVWRKEITPYTFDVTIGSSPVLFHDTVLVLCAMAQKTDSKLVAYNKADGSIRWVTSLRETGFGHSTPVLITAGGRKQLIVVASGINESARGVQSLDPANGELLWWSRGAGDAASTCVSSQSDCLLRSRLGLTVVK